MLEKEEKEEEVVVQMKWEVPLVKTSDEQLLLQASACRNMPDENFASIWCTAKKALVSIQTSADFCTSFLFAL